MKRIILAFCFTLISGIAFADAVSDWADYENDLRKGKLAAAEADYMAKKIAPALQKEFADKNIEEQEEWVFPVKGFTVADIGNLKKVMTSMATSIREPKFLDGMEFLVQQYLRLEINVKEDEQDKKDKKKKKKKNEEPTEEEIAKAKEASKADVLAANNGVVIYVKRGALNSPGGNTVWLYNPAQNFFIYYGTLRDINVNPGDIVAAGDKIGTISRGKKGFNINFTVLMFGDEEFTIYNYFDNMK